MNHKDRPANGTETPTDPPDSVRRARREDGARQTVSEPVVFHHGDDRVDGWALNMSRGGLRAIVESPLEVGREFEIELGESGPKRVGKIVWIQQEKDGAIVGVAFQDVERPSAPPPPDDA
ncbi:MAG: PilZ domain-containing protein [Deltaproteobacteria bacterium]|nr:PilZ domain-containing protein [Deltaproteobacteria bacterium]MBW2537282.1 PilZ domain-containing protein [Deltaproteobacteria bacterium]